MGDILLTSPLLRVLKKSFPEAKIDFIVKSQYADLVRTNPHVDSVYALDTAEKDAGLKKMRRQLRAVGYDLVVDAHDNFRSHTLRRLPGAQVVQLKKYKVARFFLVKFGWNLYREIVPVYRRYIDAVAPFGVEDDGHGLEFFLDQTVQADVHEKLRQIGFAQKKLTLAMAPGASFATKRWPLERFRIMAQHVKEHFDIQFLLLGDKNDAALTSDLKNALGDSAFNCAGQFNLMESACALNCADILLTNDTGLMHLGTALKKPVVAIFGSTVRELGFYPVGENSFVIENKNLTCRPCSHVGKKACPKKHFKCMMDTSEDQVLSVLLPLLKQASRT